MIRQRTLVLPLIATGLVAVASFVPTSSNDSREPTGVKVSQTSYACPAGAGIRVAAGQVTPGAASSASVVPGRKPDKALVGASTWRTSKVDGSGIIVEQQGRGSGPVGFFAATAPKASGGGLIVGSCPGVVDDAWFLGLGSGSKHFSSVILTNLGAAPAVVDLELWGTGGKIDAVGAKGVVIKSFTTQRVRVADLAAGEPELALRVLRRRGSVSVVVNDLSTAVFRGTEPVTATATPRRSQIIGGLVSGASGRTLALLNPGTTTARVEVNVIGPKNTFKPTGLEAIKVKAGSLRLVEVPSTTGSGRQALKITSDVPIAATVRMSPDNADYAYAESVPVLDGPAVVPVELGKGVGLPDLILTAPAKAASVQVLAYDRNMKQLGKATVALEAGTTNHLDTAKAFKQKGIAYLVVQPTGDVIGAATYQDGARIASLALLSAPITVLAPQVRPVD